MFLSYLVNLMPKECLLRNAPTDSFKSCLQPAQHWAIEASVNAVPIAIGEIASP